MRNVPPHLYCLRGSLACCYVLHDGAEAVVIDTGLAGETFAVRRLFRRLGLSPASLKAVLLTHGHLDHAGNVARLKDWSGATVFAHPAEQNHLDGTYPYRGATRWCGRLEAFGRAALGYRAVKIDQFLAEGQLLPFWGGLRVIHLPGHTLGHCGFYSARHQTLFSGDMFASYLCAAHRPLAIFNSAPGLIPGSAEKVRALQPRWILPQHLDFLDGALHRRRFARVFGFDDWLAGARDDGK